MYILFIIPFIYGPIVPGLLSTADANKTYYSLSQYMKTSIRPGDRIASNDEWEPSLYAAYYLNVQYYGIPKNNIDKQILYEELRKYNINRYLIWDRKVLNGVEDLHVNVGTIQW